MNLPRHVRPPDHVRIADTPRKSFLASGNRSLGRAKRSGCPVCCLGCRQAASECGIILRDGQEPPDADPHAR